MSSYMQALSMQYATFPKHGVCMCIAFLVFLPLGMLIARYARNWKHWLQLHILAQSLAFLSMLLGVYFGVTLKAAQTGHFKDLHGRFGIALVLLLMLQMQAAYLRPAVQLVDGGTRRIISKQRKSWVFTHRLFAAMLWSCGFYVTWLGLREPTVTFRVTWQLTVLYTTGVTTLIIVAVLEYNHWQWLYISDELQKRAQLPAIKI
eukprot:5265-Heterococcus_DN1.PRE.25